MSTSLPAPLDIEGRRRLVIVKQVYERAASRSIEDSRTARMMALIEFDFSIETLLRFAYTEIGMESKPPRDFLPLLKHVNDKLVELLGIGVVNRGQIERIHELRNGVQHHADYPSAEHMSRVRSALAAAVPQVMKAIWNEDFDQLDEVDSVQTPEIKDRLVKAKDALNVDEPDYERVGAYAWQAFAEALNRIRPYLVGYPLSGWVKSVYVGEFPDTFYPSSQLYESILQTQESVVLLALGVDPVRYLRFKVLTGKYIQTATLNQVNRQPGIYPLEENDARYIYDFCLESVLQIEDRLAELSWPDRKNEGPANFPIWVP